MKEYKKFKRQCIACACIKDKQDLIRITKDFQLNDIKINNEKKYQGRSVYICKNETCIKNAIKKKKIEHLLKVNLAENIKKELYTVLKK